MNQLPSHIAIIMDGNGRWAESKGLLRIEGHKAGVETVKVIVEQCIFYHIPVLSLFAFSSENWSRPADEVNFLMDLFLTVLKKELLPLKEKGVRLQFLGEREKLSASLIQEMEFVESETANESKLRLMIAINYGGQWDIVNATKQIAKKINDNQMNWQDVNEAVLSMHLQSSEIPPPDLFIRTGGERRLSNFFLWSLAYSELYFTDCFWPDFNEDAFGIALQDYALRDRRFGQIKRQIEVDNYV
jgi:undecaprenyl diphosphate synthase